MDEQRYRAAEAAVWDHWGVVPDERWVRLPSTGTRVRVLEAGHGAPTLLVHGAAIAGTSWADLVSRLAARGDAKPRRCIVIDRPGCGLSEPLPTPPGLDGLPAHAASLLVEVLDELDVGRADLVSTSMGGYFALRTAAAHPERVGRIAHLGWSLGSPPVTLPLIMRLAGAPGIGRLMARAPVPVAAVRSMLRQVGLGAAIDAGRIPEVGLRWNAALQNHTETRVHEYRHAGGAPLREQMEALDLPPDELARIVAPTTFIFGTGDPFGTPATMQALADGVADGRLIVLEGAGHAVWLDDLERVSALVTAALDGA